MKHSVESWAKAVGNTLAQVQHGMDKAIDWGFAQMREQSKQKPPSKGAAKEDSVTRTGKGILRFFGEAGNAYYRHYDELKKKDAK